MFGELSHGSGICVVLFFLRTKVAAAGKTNCEPALETPTFTRLRLNLPQIRVLLAPLALITVIPLWLPIAAFAFGLALIPLREADVLRMMPRSRMLLRSLTAMLHLLILMAMASTALSAAARAQTCPVSHDQSTNALKQSVKPSGGPGNGGFDNDEWAVVVMRQGTICAVTFSGSKPTDQWLASRAIAAEKANTANAMSVDKMAISTAKLYGGSLPGAPLYGLITTNPAIASLITSP
jgi:hypothetical protein